MGGSQGSDYVIVGSRGVRDGGRGGDGSRMEGQQDHVRGACVAWEGMGLLCLLGQPVCMLRQACSMGMQGWAAACSGCTRVQRSAAHQCSGAGTGWLASGRQTAGCRQWCPRSSCRPGCPAAWSCLQVAASEAERSAGGAEAMLSDAVRCYGSPWSHSLQGFAGCVARSRWRGLHWTL